MMDAVKLGDITVKIGSGATPRGGKNVYISEGTALIRSQNVLDLAITLEGLAFIDDQSAAKLSSVLVEPGDVLINITGDSTARVALWNMDLPARVNQHVAILRADRERLDPRWLQYWLVQTRVKDHLLLLASAGGSRPALTKRMLSDLEIPLPALTIQHKVASVLSSLDRAIATNQTAARLGRQLIQATAQTVNKRIQLKEIAVQNRRSVSTAEFDGRLVMHYSIPRFDAGSPITEPGDLIKSNKMWIQKPSVLVSKLNPETSRVWSVAVPSKDHLSIASTEFVVLEPSGITQAQLYAAAMHPGLQQQLASKVGGTSKSHQRIKPEDMLESLVPDVRNLDSDQTALLTSLTLLENQSVQQIETLSKTRNELLPLLMSGKITVKEAEQEATAAGADIAGEESEA